MPILTLGGPDGLEIEDVSQIQHRQAPYAWSTLSQVTWSDGAIGQVPIPMTIKGHKYIAYVDEGGWGNARIIDVQDELHPKIVSRLHLAINLLQNRAQSEADGADGVITYDGHYCSVPQEVDPQILMCAYAWSGIRIFDIRDPANPKQIAYYIPPAFTYAQNQTLNGSSDNTNAGGLGNGSPGVDSVDRCASKIRLYHAADGTWELWTMCQENEFIVLKFTNGAFPFGGGAPGTTFGAPAPAPAAGAGTGTPNTSGAPRNAPLGLGLGLLGVGLLGLSSLARRRAEARS